VTPRYPIYVISKGRFENCLTAKAFIRESTPFRLVVEPQEAEEYGKRYGYERIAILPFSNLGLGGIPARNWVWEDAKAAGCDRHWILDDNIRGFKRRFKAQRFHCAGAPLLAAIEDFVDRYENVAIGGLNYVTFLPDRTHYSPFSLNHHVYSCLLIRNDLPHRWRGRYNEDTDLCLQVLADGWCTVLINAFLIDKMATMTMKGGNATELYQGDGRLKMARSLERAWPHVVTVERRFKRPQHKVHSEWARFTTPLKRRHDLDWSKLPAVDEYGLELKQVTPTVRSKKLQEIFTEEQARRKRKT
jgi:hypothetical protein